MIGLHPEQKLKMDTIFNAQKGTIFATYQTLQREEKTLEAATRAKPLNEAQVFAGIDRLAQARAALERANAHMLILIRQEMTAEQIERMDSRR